MQDEILIRHMEEDAKFQEETRLVHTEQSLFKAETEGHLARLEDKIDGLATKEDIKEVLQFMKNMNIGIGIFKFSWNNAAKIGAFLLLIGGIVMFFKVGLWGALTWIFTLGRHE